MDAQLCSHRIRHPSTDPYPASHLYAFHHPYRTPRSKCNVYMDAHAHVNTHAHGHQHHHAHRYQHCNFDRHADLHQHSDGHDHINGDEYTDGYGRANQYADPDRDTNLYLNPNPLTYPDRHANAVHDSDQHSDHHVKLLGSCADMELKPKYRGTNARYQSG